MIPTPCSHSILFFHHFVFFFILDILIRDSFLSPFRNPLSFFIGPAVGFRSETCRPGSDPFSPARRFFFFFLTTAGVLILFVFPSFRLVFRFMFLQVAVVLCATFALDLMFQTTPSLYPLLADRRAQGDPPPPLDRLVIDADCCIFSFLDCRRSLGSSFF